MGTLAVCMDTAIWHRLHKIVNGSSSLGMSINIIVSTGDHIGYETQAVRRVEGWAEVIARPIGSAVGCIFPSPLTMS